MAPFQRLRFKSVLGMLSVGLLCLTDSVQPLASPTLGNKGRLKPDSLLTASHSSNVVLQRKTTQKEQHTEVRPILAAAEDPPEICFGQGNEIPIYFTDWESGLESWVPATRNIVNPATFDTEDWQTVAELPNGRAGAAAFVANLDAGDCVSDDETGVLTLTSPDIPIPDGALVPRVSFDHWYAIEHGWDGGNLRLIVNNGPPQLISPSAIEYNSYNSVLLSADDSNSNPMAGEAAYTGSSSGWVQTWVNLHGLTETGDTIRLRYDFGIDGCKGVTGWYVDDVQVYACSDELPPSDCGNGLLDPGEQCDDDNNIAGDGCSDSCQVEPGWKCTDPVGPVEIPDGGFEAGTPNPYWTEESTNFVTPICNELSCGLGTGSGPATGEWWSWFGGIKVLEESSLKQTIWIPLGAEKLTFKLEASACDSSSDFLEVRIDNVRKWIIDGNSQLCGLQGFTLQTVDISEFGNGYYHSLEFHAKTFGNNLDVTNFFVDDVAIPGAPSKCGNIIYQDSFESN